MHMSASIKKQKKILDYFQHINNSVSYYLLSY